MSLAHPKKKKKVGIKKEGCWGLVCATSTYDNIGDDVGLVGRNFFDVLCWS